MLPACCRGFQADKSPCLKLSPVFQRILARKLGGPGVAVRELGMARPAKKRRAVPSPPADAAAGAALVRQFVVALFDRRDGNGVNWKLVAETLFRAAFDVLDKLPDEDRRAMARRVHTGAYDRAAGNTAGEEAEKPKPPVEASKAVVFAKASRPRPPR